MAGYKKSIKKLKPSCFITFDGDSFFDTSGYLRYPHIHDERGNENHGYIITGPDNVKSYALGSFSLVDREGGADQYSICLAPRSHDPYTAFPYDKSMVEIMHTDMLNMKDEFTVMLLFRKQNNDGFFASATYNQSTNKYETTSYTYKNFKRVIFKKGVTLGLEWQFYWNYTDTLRFIFPDHNWEWQVPGDFYNRTYHITMTRKKINIGTSLFKTIDSVYIDSRLVYTKESNITSETSTAFSTSSIFLGGSADQYDMNYLEDRQTSPLS